MSLAETLKNPIVIVVSGIAIAAFGSGSGAYKASVEAQDQELILKTQRTELERNADELITRKSSQTGTEANASKPRPIFSDGQWRYVSMPSKTGVEVATRLTEIGPPEDAVAVACDGSANNTFHVWYRGQGTATKYTDADGAGIDLADPPRKNYLLHETGIIPAGIAGAGNSAVPIYFLATR